MFRQNFLHFNAKCRKFCLNIIRIKITKNNWIVWLINKLLRNFSFGTSNRAAEMNRVVPLLVVRFVRYGPKHSTAVQIYYLVLLLQPATSCSRVIGNASVFHGQEISCLLLHPQFCYRIHRTRILARKPSQTNPAYNLKGPRHSKLNCAV